MTFTEFIAVERVLEVLVHRLNDKIVRNYTISINSSYVKVECKQAFPKAITDALEEAKPRLRTSDDRILREGIEPAKVLENTSKRSTDSSEG